MSCRVQHCRHKHKHTTREHICGKCGQKGHGQIECGSNYKKDMLKHHFDDVLPLEKKCKSKNCPNKEYHTTESHICETCNQRHTFQDCPNRTISLKCPICRTDNTIPGTQPKLFGLSEDNKCKVCLENPVVIFLPQCGHACLCSECLEQLDTTVQNPISSSLIRDDIVVYNRGTEYIESNTLGLFENCLREALQILDNDNRKVFIQKYAGMGCLWFFRQENSNSDIEGFFMHSDNWGQYGPLTDDRQKLDEFVLDYRDITAPPQL